MGKQKQIKKGKKGKCPLETGAGATSCISVYSFNYYTVIQNIAVVQRGCLRIFAPSIKKKGDKKGGQKGEKGEKSLGRPAQERLPAFQLLLSIATPFIKISQSCNVVFLQL